MLGIRITILKSLFMDKLKKIKNKFNYISYDNKF